MPTVNLNKKEVLSLIGKKLSDEELSEAITYIGTDLEEITETEIVVEIFPNRPDLLSEQGLSRAIASFLGIKKGLAEFNIKKSDYKVIVEKSAKDARPFTSCAVVKGLKLDDAKIKEIIQIQEKLHVTFGRNRKKVAIGVYPLNKIEFPVKLIGEDPKKITFQPLEYPSEITGLQVLSKHPTGRDYAKLLEGFDTFPFFVDAKNNVLSMPPIINSHTVGKVELDTTDVFVECSGFSQDVLDTALHMVVSALADMGGDLYSVEVENKHAKWTKSTPNFTPTEMDIDVSYVNKLLGLKLSEKEVSELLEKMGFGIKGKKALIPAYRSDILHMADLVEDIAIAYNYQNFKPDIPSVATIGKRDSIELFKTKIAEILTGLGHYETNTYCLTGAEKVSHITDDKPVVLANSVAEGYDILRNNMLVSLLDVLRNNRNRVYPQGFFEVGFVFRPDQKAETKISEGRELAFVFANPSADYTQSRQVIDYLLTQLQIPFEIKTPKKETKAFMEGRYAEIIVSGKTIGQVGQISPAVLDTFELEVPVTGFTLDFLKLVEELQK